MKRGIECTCLLDCDAVRWASTTNVLSSCIAVASPRAVLTLQIMHYSPASHLSCDTASHRRRPVFRNTIVSALILQKGLRGPPRADVVTAYPCKGQYSPGG
jgi:hypothetical protein